MRMKYAQASHARTVYNGLAARYGDGTAGKILDRIRNRYLRGSTRHCHPCGPATEHERALHQAERVVATLGRDYPNYQQED